MNELYSKYNQPKVSVPQFRNPIEKMQYMLQAMQNPAAFAKQFFPDIPQQIQNNPIQILSYLQETRNISNQDIQNLWNNNPYPGR